MKKILILGGGFAGLVAAERLGEYFGRKHQITLVSPHRIFTFYPALVRVAFGELAADDITFDLVKKLNKLGVRFVEGEVLRIKPEYHRVQVTGKEFNGDLSYDHLVIAMGRRLATEKTPGFFDHAHHLLGVKAAEKFGRAVAEFEEGEIVVGLAPDSFLPVPVCETAFSLAKRFRQKIAENRISVTVVFPETIERAFGGAEKIGEELRKAFEKHRIKVVEDFPAREISKKEIISGDLHKIPYDLLMMLPSFRGQARLSENGITDELNFVEVDKHMRITRLKNAYAAGDIVSFPGPKLAHIAVGQAQVAAVNLMREVEQREPDAVYYHEIASIIDQGGADSIYLHYGIWDESLYRLKKGPIWGLVKRLHDRIWQTRHKSIWLEKGV